MTFPLNKRITAFLALLLVLVSLAYSNTLSVPFNFDDEVVIKNEIATNGQMFFDYYPPRYRHLFYLSLAFNYSQGTLDPFGYHLINLSLHFLTSITVFFIALITIEKGMSRSKREAFSTATITTLLFALSPVLSETANYISARAVGMSSFFYLSALLLFIVGSLNERNNLSRILFYVFALTSFLASILSKETSLTFPIAILLYDFCFMRMDCWTSLRNRVLFFYLPMLACGIFAIFKVLAMKTMILDWWDKIDFNFALKQARIVGHGIHLLLFPIGLTFDYDFPDAFFPHPAFIAWPIALSLGFLFFIAKYFRDALAVVSFGICWFFLVLAPTNSLFPRQDLLSERNLYLPSFGIFLLLAIAGYHFILAKNNRPIIRKIGVCCIVVFLIFQTALLYKRNSTYKSNTLLWEDTLKKAPANLQALHNLSHFYLVENNHKKAFVALHSLANSGASPHYISYAHSNLGTLYLQLKNYSKAEAAFKKGIQAKPSLPTNHLNLGTVYAFQGRYPEAKDAYEKAESLYTDFHWGYRAPAELYLNQARVLLTLGLYQKAEASAVTYIKHLPKSGPGHFILAKIYAAMGEHENALREYNQVGNNVKLQGEALNNKALIFIKQNLFDRALEELSMAVTIYPDLLDAHYNLGNLLIQTEGDPIRARKHLETAFKLSTNPESRRRIKLALDTLS